MAIGITRRDALKTMGAMAGTAVVAPRLAGCGGDGGPGKLDTIVVVMMENRSYDHFLGARKLLEQRPGDGLTAGMSNMDMSGTVHSIYRETVDCVADPPHGWDAGRLQFNGGKNDGFMTQYQVAQGAGIGPHVMGYFGREDVPVTWALADAYTTCDRWFCSVMGPTFPNRYYLHSAQAGGHQDNAINTDIWPTIYNSLDAAGISWKYYYTDLPFLALLPGVDQTKWASIAEFYADAQAGDLPRVTVIDPGFTMNDDHPPHHPMFGQLFISSIYSALAKSRHWSTSLLVVTYDEHGGFFDHVPPPTAPDDRAALGFDQLGFRVPTLIAGPYVKTDYVSSVRHDHTSVLKHIENTFGLSALTMRDAAANDLSDAIDQKRFQAGDAAAPVTLPMIVAPDPASLDPLCTTSDFLIATDIERAANQGVIAPELDLRRYRRETFELIGNYAANHGLGGYRGR